MDRESRTEYIQNLWKETYAKMALSSVFQRIKNQGAVA